MRAQASRAVHVREDVRAEPLVHGFRAWPHLIAPHTLARNLTEKHLPALGASAAVIGGTPRTEASQQAHPVSTGTGDALARLSTAIRELDELMLAEARGYSVEHLYRRVPECLRGMVELAYDRYNHPQVRYLERALYRRYSDTTRQSVELTAVDPDAPSPGMRTPRRGGEGTVALTVPFASGWWDVLGRARRAPRDGAELSADLEMTPEQLALLSSDLPPLPLTVAPPAPIRVRFFGHACALVETAAAAVMFDPLVALRRRGQTDRFSFADLPERLDYVVITHGHLDHLDIETLLQVRHLTERVVVPRTGAGDLLDPNLKLILENLGFPCVVELDEFEAAELPGGRLTAVPFFGEHGDLVVRGKSGYLLELAGRSLLFVADSSCHEPAVYEMVREQAGAVDAVFLGMECEGSPMTTASGPYLGPEVATEAMAQDRRTKASDAASALRLVRASGARRAFVYAMGLEPWLSYMFGAPDPTRSYSLGQVEVFLRELAATGVAGGLLRGPQVLGF